ncbi:hypothetical protein D3C81_1023950 [compost metagenome]
MLPLQTQVHAQGLAPGQIAGQLAAPRFATAPTAIELNLLTRDRCLQRQVFQAYRQLGATDFAMAQHQVAVDLWCKQGTRQTTAAIQLPGQALDHGHERAGDRQVQARQAEIPRQRLVFAQWVEVGVQTQFTQALAAKIQAGVDTSWRQRAVQAQGLIGEVDPAPLVTHPQGAATGVYEDAALGATGRDVQVDVSVQQALPGKVLWQPLG